jgi:hypothetical protein
LGEVIGHEKSLADFAPITNLQAIGRRVRRGDCGTLKGCDASQINTDLYTIFGSFLYKVGYQPKVEEAAGVLQALVSLRFLRRPFGEID